MPKLSFDFAWLDTEQAGFKGPELSATWACLEMRVGDATITRIWDSHDRTVRDSVHVPLYPLAEWLATNWWFLTHEFKNPTKEGDRNFHRRHSLSTNRDGYAFPSLEAASSGALTHLVWRGNPPPRTSVEFLERGEEWVESGEFQEVCSGFIEQVIGQLGACGITDSFLQEEWDAIKTADEEETSFCETAAGLGWDPYDLDNEKLKLVLGLPNRLGELLTEAVPALDTDRLDAGLSAIIQAMREAKNHGLPLQRLESFHTQCGWDQMNQLEPWEGGYLLAQRLRENLNLGNAPIRTVKEMADALAERVDLLEKMMQPVDSFSQVPLIDGVVTRDDDKIPAFAFRKRGDDDATRFHFSRALAEVLTPSISDTLITRATSERQQRNRAFAAEFLAPSGGLRDIVPNTVVDVDDIEEMAAEFGVSSLVIFHQVQNHRIARVL